MRLTNLPPQISSTITFIDDHILPALHKCVLNEIGATSAQFEEAEWSEIYFGNPEEIINDDYSLKELTLDQQFGLTAFTRLTAGIEASGLARVQRSDIDGFPFYQDYDCRVVGTLECGYGPTAENRILVLWASITEPSVELDSRWEKHTA